MNSFVEGLIQYIIPRKYKKLKPGVYTAKIEECVIHRNSSVTLHLSEIKRKKISHTGEG